MLKHSTALERDKINSIAIGGFDGIHLAHQQLLSKLTSKGAVVIIDKGYANLTPEAERCNYTAKPCIFIDLNAIRELSGEAFINFLQKQFPNLKLIIVGYDFRFGKDRKNNANDLKKLFQNRVEIVDEVTIEQISIHSQTIRNYLTQGDIQIANKLLGRTYSIKGEVIKGLGLGKKELYPTLNMNTGKFLLPKEGVYATFTMIDSILLPSVTFIGKRASIDNSFSVETHILQKNINKAVDKIEISFLKYMRDNKKFSNLKDLKLQIEKDICFAETIHQL